MTGRVYLSAPDVGELEQSFVRAALRSGWVAPAGPHLAAFERDLAGRVGVSHAVAVSSGTAALHLALLAMGIGSGDAVVVPTLTFTATANAVLYTGATPVFVDCDPVTGNIDPDLLARALASLRRDRQRVGAVMTVDMLGRCADYDAVGAVCAEYGVPVLEDAAEALGATYRGRPAGSFGRAAAVSFNGNKVLTTSGGGMVLSDDAGLTERCRYLASQARLPVPHYEHADVGFNYRLSNVLAALGQGQLRRLDAMLARRRALRERYRGLFAGVGGTGILGGADDAEDNCWLTVVVVDPAVAGWSAQELGAHLAAADIETRPMWKPMHLQPLHRGARAVLSGAAERLFATGLALPSGSALTAAQAERVETVVRQFLGTRRSRPARRARTARTAPTDWQSPGIQPPTTGVPR